MKPTHSIPEVLKNAAGVLFVFLTASLGSQVVSAQISSQSLQKSQDNYVRVIYLIPADSTENPEYTMALENAARHLQKWYFHALGQNKTFALHDPVVEVYQTPHEALWYATNPNGSPFYQFWYNVLQDGFQLTGGRENDPNNRWVFYMDANPGCDQCSGCGGNGLVVIGANDLKGLAGYEIDKSCPNFVHSYEPCRYVGGMGHELGHALGLNHPPDCTEEFPNCWEKDLMMYGYITYPDAFFNEADKIRLSSNPFIRNIDIEDLYYPSTCMRLTDTCNISLETERSIFCGDSIILEGKYQNTAGIYYDTLKSIADCDTILVTSLSILNPPPDVEDVRICEGEPVPNLLAIGKNIRWYDDAELKHLIYAGDTLKTEHTAVGTYTYYVTQSPLECGESLYATITLNISPIPLPPITLDTACCDGEHIQFLEALGNNITWYSDAELTHQIWSGNRFNVEAYPIETGENIFYVTQTIANCISLSSTLSYTINPIPQTPVNEDHIMCQGDTDPILISRGENINWYQDADSVFVDSRDGQEYSTVKIGDQVWMAQNLNYYTFSGSWYYEADSISYAASYGRLYDFTAARKVCPSGWHLPDDSEWQEMIDFLGGDSIAGGKLKEEGNRHWLSPNSEASNQSGFTALPAGKYENDRYYMLGETANFWSDRAIWEMGNTFLLTHNSTEILQEKLYFIDEGASVRCIKDQSYEHVYIGDSLSISNTQTGTYLFYTTQTIKNCSSPFETITLTIHPIPSVDLGKDTTILMDQILTLDVENPGYSYLWSDGSEMAQIQISSSELGLGDHLHWVVVRDGNACSNSDSIVIKVIDPVNSQFNKDTKSIKLYPNPVNDLLYIQTGDPGKHIVEITSIKGELLYKDEYTGNHFQIDLSYFGKGMYFIKVKSETSAQELSTMFLRL